MTEFYTISARRRYFHGTFFPARGVVLYHHHHHHHRPHHPHHRAFRNRTKNTRRVFIGVEDSGKGGICPPPRKKIVKISSSSRYRVKFGHFVNFWYIYFLAKRFCLKSWLSSYIRLRECWVRSQLRQRFWTHHSDCEPATSGQQRTSDHAGQWGQRFRHYC